MAEDDLQPVGVRAVVENFNGFRRAMRVVNKALGSSSKQATAAGRSYQSFNKKAQNTGVQVTKTGKSAKSSALGWVGLAAKLHVAMIAFDAVAKAAQAAFQVMVRGARLAEIRRSFDIITEGANLLSDALLNKLQTAARGTINELELMRTTNLALAGITNNQVAQAIGQNLPKLLDVARAQAAATGQSVQFLYNSLITGIKRSSPLLIDNTGLVISVADAKQRMADQIGVTVDQITGELEQLAILNATLEAGGRAVEQYGNLQELATTKLARAQTTIRDSLDTIGESLQDAFGPLLDVVNLVLGAIQRLIEAAVPWLRALGRIIGDALKDFLGLAEGIENIDWNRVARSLFIGATNMAGSLIAPIVRAATVIQNIVIRIATFIADFLTGFSPPKKGPLKDIDKGAARMMQAWISGITGVGLDPVEKVAQDVQQALTMGGVAGLGRRAVEQRLKALDKALQPFSDRLKIVKANFEALREPAEAALRAVDRQLKTALKGLFEGAEGSAAVVRQIDRQREALQGTIREQQRMVDQAQIQLGLAKSQQARERALLEIRKAQLKPLREGAKTAVSAERAVAKARKARGKAETPGAAIDLEEAGLVGRTDVPRPGGEENIPGFLQFTETMGETFRQQNFRRQIETAFGEASGLTEFQAGQAELETQMGRIQGAIGGGGLGQEIARSFGNALFDVSNKNSLAGRFHHFFNGEGKGTLRGVVSDIESWFNEHVGGPIQNAWNAIFDVDRDGSPANIVHTFFNGTGPGTIQGAVGDIEKWWNEHVSAPISNAWDSIFDPEREGSVAARLNTFFNGEGEGTLRGILASIPGADIVQNIFGGLINWIQGTTDPLTGETTGGLPHLIDELVTWFRDLPGFILQVASNFWTDIKANIFQPVIDWVNGSAEGGGLPGLIDNLVSGFRGLPRRIVNVLRTLGAAIWNIFVPPFVGAVNAVIDILNSFLSNRGVEVALATIQAISSEFTGAPIRNVSDLRISHVDMPSNPFNFASGVSAFNTSSTPGAAEGGIFGRGLLRVGERGEEMIGAANRIAVFPNNLTRAIDTLNSILSPALAMAAPGAFTSTNQQTTNNNQQTINATFNNAQRPDEMMSRLAMLRAGRR